MNKSKAFLGNLFYNTQRTSVMEGSGQVARSGADLLAAERKGASFPVRDLTFLLYPAPPRRLRFLPPPPDISF
jgi:hypothetical protein